MSNTTITLETPMTYAGVNYKAGENEMSEDAAKYAISRKFGTAAHGKKADEAGEKSDQKDENFEPLSFEETMKRVDKTDFSDQVLKSLQHHQKTVKEFKESGLSPEKFLEKLKADDEAIQKLPLNFPMRHVFLKLGEKYDSVEKIQAISLEDLIALDGIAEPSAKKALEYKRSN